MEVGTSCSQVVALLAYLRRLRDVSLLAGSPKQDTDVGNTESRIEHCLNYMGLQDAASEMGTLALRGNHRTILRYVMPDCYPIKGNLTASSRGRQLRQRPQMKRSDTPMHDSQSVYRTISIVPHWPTRRSSHTFVQLLEACGTLRAQLATASLSSPTYLTMMPTIAVKTTLNLSFVFHAWRAERYHILLRARLASAEGVTVESWEQAGRYLPCVIPLELPN